ncbi:MAG: hypothetical protein KW793_03245 [Candidatus Doudnabacteria bacterium]|nr:hypothetical protein [Candidatus Doudnabacteria bacterium]
MKKQPELTNKVVIKDGKVVRVDVWCLWNRVPWMTIKIGQETDPTRLTEGEFYSHISDPEHGGGSMRGSLDQVLEGLHPRIKANYVALFGLNNPNQATIGQLGFLRHQVESLDS